MDVDRDQHEPNIEPEIEPSEMQDRGGADFGFHSLLIHNNNCEGPDESDEDSFDSDDGFCSADDDESLFNESVVINDKLATTATVIRTDQNHDRQQQRNDNDNDHIR